MKKHLHKFESTLWLVIKALLYSLLLLTFIMVQKEENIGLRRLSRTMGITVFTFAIVGLLLLPGFGFLPGPMRSVMISLHCSRNTA